MKLDLPTPQPTCTVRVRGDASQGRVKAVGLGGHTELSVRAYGGQDQSVLVDQASGEATRMSGFHASQGASLQCSCQDTS